MSSISFLPLVKGMGGESDRILVKKINFLAIAQQSNSRINDTGQL
ncbi:MULTISPECIES: hypothetical protein [unclassified Microcoleus]|nr:MULTISPECIES: hypothetical protein [unclassified Microcoleus]